VQRRALRPRKAAKLLVISESHLLRMVKEGQVEGIRFGKGCIFIPVSEVERLPVSPSESNLGEPIRPEGMEAPARGGAGE